MSECGMRNAECGIRSSEFGVRNLRRFRILHSALRIPLIPHSALRTPHSGVTLVELLITITIIAVLGTAILGVASVATNSAREARTRNIIARLHPLLMEHYDSYKVRRVKLNQNVENAINSQFSNPNQARQRGEALAQARLYALRELMLMEMPDRWSDVVLGPVVSAPQAPLYLDAGYGSSGLPPRTGVASIYLRQLNRILGANNSLTGARNTTLEILQNQSAECFYLTIMNATGDGEARGLFSESDIGDTDGDGAMEFLDSWGNPISFIRWAPAFESDAQLNLGRFADEQALQVAAAADHDPFDLFRREPTAFRLVPLIYSRGSDEESGINGNDEDVENRRADLSVPWYSNTNSPPLSPFAGPYYQYANFSALQLGPGFAVNRDTATDNIHNHLIGTR